VFPELLRTHIAGIVDLSAEQVVLLEAHYELMVRWNRVLNLTSVRTVEEAVLRHYCESLFLGSRLPAGSLHVCDIGSGAGFPGIPLAVLRPECSITLIESHQRKAVFLREATRAMPNLEVFAVRAEEVAGEYDHAISRAVSYEDLAPVLQKLGQSADLLTGAEDPPANLGFSWTKAVPLPWGKHRVLRMGRRV